MNGSSSLTSNTTPAQGGGVYFVNGGSLSVGAGAKITLNTGSTGGGIYRIDNGFGSITGVTATNVTGNTPNNCVVGNGGTPPVPGCVG